MSPTRRASLTVIAGLSALVIATAAHATPVYTTGTSFTASGQTAAGTFSQTATLSSGTQFIDGGALSLNVSFAAATGGAEWVIFKVATTGCDVSAPAGSRACFAPISKPGDDISFDETGIVLGEAANFSAAYLQFNDNGKALTPTSSIFAGYSPETNPISGTGVGFGASGFVDNLPAGPVPELGFFIDPFSFLGDTGIDVSKVNGFEQAYLFTPTAVVRVPEPSSLALLAAGLCGLGFIRRRRMG